MAVPVGTALNRVISMTSSADPIELNETPTITIQLRASDGTTPLSEVATVTLSANKGILSAPTVTTNGSGVGTFTYKPAKEAGAATITATSPTFVDASLRIMLNVPATSTEQNWLETSDIKAGAITTEKLAEDAVINSTANAFRQTNPSNWWFAEKGYVQDYWYVGLADSVNTVIGDDDRYIYVHGYAVTGNVDPSVVKVDKYNGATGGIYTYVNANLQAGGDSMAYDGRYLYTTSLTDMLKINLQDMTLEDTIPSGGASQFYMSRWDTRGVIYSYLFGGGDYKMMKLYPANGELETISSGLPSVNISRNVEIASNTLIWAMNQAIFFTHLAWGGHTLQININSDLGIDGGITGIVATNNKLYISINPNGGETVPTSMLRRYNAENNSGS